MRLYARVEQHGGLLHLVLEASPDGRVVVEIGAFGNPIAGIALDAGEARGLRDGLSAWLDTRHHVM